MTMTTTTEDDDKEDEVLACLSTVDRQTLEAVLYPGARGFWVSRVLHASSEFKHGWEKENLVGPPNNNISGGDNESRKKKGTWAPAEVRGGREVLVLEFPEALHCTNVLVVEAREPGHVVRVSVPVAGEDVVLTEAPPPTALFDVYHQPLAEREAAGTMPPRARRVFVVPTLASPHRRRVLVLELDTSHASAWVELEAVALLGVHTLALLPCTRAFYPASLHAAAHALASARPGLPWSVRAAVVQALYRAWMPTTCDHCTRELAVARAACGPSALRRAWLCRGTARGCPGGVLRGSGIVASGSSPCAAAVHAGAVPARTGGLFRLCPAPPAAAAPSPPSLAHGVSALPFGSSSDAFVVVPFRHRGSSNNDYSNTGCGQKGGVWYCCGVRHGCTGGPVWGTHIYAAHSNPCRAALHAGAIGPDGGLFLFVKASLKRVVTTTATASATQHSFVGSTGAWGVRSQSWNSSEQHQEQHQEQAKHCCVAVVFPVLLNNVVAPEEHHSWRNNDGDGAHGE